MQEFIVIVCCVSAFGILYFVLNTQAEFTKNILEENKKRMEDKNE